MALSQGMRLGTYEIVDLLGAGGMGEVYRARDLKLKRDVALKVLPDAFSGDADRVARFRREAEVLAALNHPNIAAIYGLEEAHGTTALVMEVVESGPLAFPLGIDTALDYARQIAEALEAAHEKGIIHRDLKPANIKVTPAGVVKVLDFGLAAMVQQGVDAGNASNPQNSPTLTRTLGTQPGMILGTAGYMSPEQAAGKVVDKRSDIWSFGVVLFEMLTGQPLFEGGETVSHLLADVLRAPIDLSRLPAATPTAIRELIERCLERDLKNRLRDIGEARIAIDRARKTGPQTPTVSAVRSAHSRLWIFLAGSAALVAVVAGFGWWRAGQPVERPLLRFTDNVGEEVVLNSANGPSIAISPDGLRLVFLTRDADGRPRLSLRLMSSSKAAVLSGADAGAAAPFFSPDGRWIAFFSGSKLKKISVDGGAAVTLCDVGGSGQPRGGYWGDDGNILFATQRSPLMRVSSSGGAPVAATELNEGEVTNRFAQLLPGGEAFLFTSSRDNNVWDDASIHVQTIKTGVRKTLVTAGGYFGRYIGGPGGTGYLIYLHGGTVFAVEMDLNRLELKGAPVPLLDDVSGPAQNGFAQMDLNQSGTIVYVPGSSRSDRLSLAFLDASGQLQALPAPQALYVSGARPSPDGTRIAVRISEESGTNVSVFELATNRMTRLTFVKSVVPNAPVWTPDGKHLVFPISSNDLAGPGIYWIRADGAGEPQRLLDSYNVPWSFSPDGKRLAYFNILGTGQTDYGIWTLPLNLDDPEHPKPGKPQVFLQSKALLINPSFSPDGRWIAYISAETLQPQAFVRPFTADSQATGGKWQVSTDAAQTVAWSRTGREILYLSRGGGAWSVSYTASGDSFVAGPPRSWLERIPVQMAGPPELMPDGKRFVIVTPGPDSPAQQTHLTFLLNFSHELQRRIGAGK